MIDFPPRPSRGGGRLPSAAVAAVVLVGCGEPPPPPAVDLAADFEPDPSVVADPPVGTIALPPGEWSPAALPGVLETTLPATAPPSDAVELWIDGELAERADVAGDLPTPSELAAIGGQWVGVHGVVMLVEDEPPEDAELRFPLEVGFPGPHAWRLRLPGITGDGLPLLPGRDRTLAIPPADVERELLFESYVAGGASSSGAALAPARFAVLLDGRPAAEFEHPVDLTAPPTPRRVSVPAGVEQITLRVEGTDGLAAALAPRVQLAAGPPDPALPDIVVVLADTLRADMLRVYRGDAVDPGPMPLTDARAARARVYLHARSPSSWTLPAQASLLTGLPPLGHGAVSAERALPPAMPRLATALRAAGYRTAAVTEGAYVSAHYGLDVGFERFDETSRSIEDTVARSLDLLASADDRPLFLFVQSYRAHGPYLSGAEGPPGALARELPLDLAPELAAVEPLDPGLPLAGATGERRLGILRGKVELDWINYLGAVRALDAGLEPLWTALDRGRADRSTYVVFTSDHGEEFGEHAGREHGHAVWEELIHVPLFVHGPGVAPGLDDAPVTLLDLAPTIAAWAGVAPDPAWVGRPLDDVVPDRAAFAWACATPPHAESRATVVGDHKRIEWPAAGEASFFDLGADPGEREPLTDADAATVAARFEAQEELLRFLSRPAAEAAAAPELSAEQAARLRALGYLTEE